MPEVRTINYATPPAGHFWKWSAEFDAIEWQDGATLAMWPEVHTVLDHLKPSGIPPLGSLLLLLAACRDGPYEDYISFHDRLLILLQPKIISEGTHLAGAAVMEAEAAVPSIRYQYGQTAEGKIQGSPPNQFLDSLVAGLEAVSELPGDLRSSLAAKCHLASLAFQGSSYNLSRKDSKQVLEELSTLGPRSLGGYTPRFTSDERLKLDLRALQLGVKIHQSGTLESLLRTGLENSEIQPVPLPEKAAETGDPKLLLDKLAAAGGESGAAAAVARRAIAMMNFPGHVGTPRDLPVGGIADITNRGTIDRLLPGELAWDDLVLAARLVHNEALYFRREIPPMNVAVAHTILLGRELRLWGVARVFSLGVALGLWHHPALNGAGETFECVAATLEDFEYLELDTTEKVRAALETLVPAEGPRDFLEKWWAAAQIVNDPALPDVSLITERDHLEDPDMRKLLGEVATWIHSKGGHFRILALGRDGDLEVQAWTPGGNRTLFRGEMDLEQILRDSRRGADRLPASKAAFPIRRPEMEDHPLRAISPIYGLEKLPFLFPLVPQGSAFLPVGADGGGIGVAVKGQFMQWPKAGWGAFEILPKIPGRQHWIGREDHGPIVVIASGEKAGDSVRVFRWKGKLLEEIEVAASRHACPRHAAGSGGAAVLAYADKIEALSLRTGHRLAEISVKAAPTAPVLVFDGENISVIDSGKKPSFNLEAWSFVSDRSWPRMIVPEQVSLVDGILHVKSASLVYRFDPAQTIWQEAKTPVSGFVALDAIDVSSADGLAFKTARLGERLQVWYDSRGMLHLQDLGSVPLGESAAWSIMLSTPATSIWSPKRGLFATDKRLKTEQPEILWPFPQDLLVQFLSFESYQSSKA